MRGTLLTTVISPGAHTRTSFYAAFTSLYPSINKMTAIMPQFLKKLDPLAVMIMDILQYNGYKTFHYQDPRYFLRMKHLGQNAPTSGIMVYESTKYRKISETPKRSYVTPKRNAFIENFNKSTGPKFVFIHLMAYHDLNVEDMNEVLDARGHFALTEEAYENNLLKASEDFKDVWEKLQISEKSLVIISTDHGARLGFPGLFKKEQRFGMRLKDISMNTFCSFIGPNIPKQIINHMVRTIDIVPQY